MSPASVVLAHWSFVAARDGCDWIMPDGCRDVIWFTGGSREPEWFVSKLDDGPRSVRLASGVRYTGLRLRPGVVIDESALARSLSSSMHDSNRIEQGVVECCRLDTGLDEVFIALHDDIARLDQLCGRLGVSARSLQRQLERHRLPSPGFWIALARARRCARLLQPELSLVDVAAAAGYSDQAHMTRECRRWFGMTPARLQRDASRQRSIAASGLATTGDQPTGEQISTR